MIGTTFLLLAAATIGVDSGAGTAVTITFTGTQPSGKVFARVYSTPESFKARDNAVAQVVIEGSAKAGFQTTVTLPPGRYAIGAFQDTKGTGKLETNLLGMPVVPYGFSNNARGMVGPPGFDAAAIDVGTSAMSLTIQLR
jgi:uncharacterized protein (DUF2141 family)